MTARECAVKVLAACRRDGAWSDGKLKTELQRARLGEQDAALCTRIVYGVEQNMALLDFYIGRFCSAKKLEPRVRDILRTGMFQIVFLTRVPESAAVNEAVALTKKLANPRAAGLVNASLRAAARAKDALPEPKAATPEETLAIKYSHPEWLVKEFAARIGLSETEKLLRLDNAAAPVTVQVNTLVSDMDDAARSLEEEEVAVRRHAALSNCFELENTGNIARLTAFTEGMIRVQDAAAAVAAAVGEPKAGETVIDACAAPGGKSFAAAALMENSGKILAFDLHEHKLELIDRGAERLKIGIIQTGQHDASEFMPQLKGGADLVIADVPCSGLGTIRKKPDVRYKAPESLDSLPPIQEKILATVSQYVKTGGRLVYSTCTLRRAENEDIVAAFLKKHPDFSAEEFKTPLGDSENGMLTLWPHIHGTDGFFIARLRQNG